ncbi:MAG TPA: PfkB family carbohydrate kinase [Ktedonobacterales bacterium]|nr:PfkB family carbohydrate kinase [Ktedonobacterales bacterium]
MAVVRHATERPDFLAIGHITRDSMPGGDWRLGGTVTYAALTAARLGLRAAIVTSAPADLVAALDVALPDIPLSVLPSAKATTFENIYTAQSRQQFLRGRAEPLTLSAVPDAWREAPIALLGPVAQEIAASIVGGFPNSLVAATPQGWLRQWDAEGAVTPSPLASAEMLLPDLRALILSREDIGESADTVFSEWARIVPLIAVTCSRDGAYVWEHGVRSGLFAGYPAHEVDPTGAGDVFAAAFLCELHATGEAARAVDFANRVAACSVEAAGGEGIPTREMVAARWNTAG